MKFKVGDRVAVYGHRCLEWMRTAGTVLQVATDKHEGCTMLIKVPQRGDVYAHPKQCRRLVKKERRRVYIPLNDLHARLNFKSAAELLSYLEIETDGSPNYMEFVEVRRKK